MIFLSSPYSADPDRLYTETMRYAAAFHQDGARIYSPILHWHETAKRFAMPTDAEWWWEYNVHFLSIAAALWVLTIPGWRESIGVQKEIEWWRVNRKCEIKFVGPEAE